MTNQTVNEAVKQKSVEGLVCVTLEVHLWSGRKRLKKEKLIAKNPEFEKLPPESLATLGAIKICDPDDLAPFLRMKREAEKLLAINGLPVLGTTGIPESKLDAVFKGLARIQSEFNQKLSDFYKRFNDAIELWQLQDENKEWLSLLSEIPTPDQVAGKMSFGFHLCRVNAPSSDEFSDANQMYAKQMTGLKGELFADAAAEAEILMTKYLTGSDANGIVKKREKVTWKTMRPLKRIGEKFESFSFLDPTCEPMAKMIDHVLKLLPTDGPIDGVHLMHIWTLSQTLAKPAKAMQIAKMAFESESSADAFEHLLAFDSTVQTATTAPAAIPAEPVSQAATAAAVQAGFIDEPVATAGTQPAPQAPVVPAAQAPQGQPIYQGLF